jgi:hypothetical protein
MKPESEKYKKLPGRGTRRGRFPITFQYSRLWLGSDHLLMVTSTSWSEVYRRFSFRDIQGFVVRQTAGRRNWNILFGIWAALFALPAIRVEHDTVSNVLWGLAIIPFLALLVNSFRGPTCECQIVTAVQKQFLPSLNRMSVARRVFARVKPHMEQAQGTLTPEEIAARADAWVQAPEAATAMAIREDQDRTGRGLSHYAGQAHLLLFTLLLIESVRAGMDFYFRSTLVTLLAMMTGAAIVIMVIIALVKQQDSAMPGSLRRWTWATFLFVLLLAANGFVHYISLIIQNPDLAHSDAAILQVYVQMAPDESPWMMTSLLLAIFGSGILGGVGLLMVRKFREKRKTPPPLISLDQTPPVSHA